MNAERIEIFRQNAMSYLGVPYIYGGKNRLQGEDCSGFVCEQLEAMGLLPTGTVMNASGLYWHLKEQSQDQVYAFGSIAFYGKSLQEIDHVAFFLDEHFLIEAGHGTSETKTKEEAMARGAYVRVRPFDYRKDLVAVIRPLYENLGL